MIDQREQGNLSNGVALLLGGLTVGIAIYLCTKKGKKSIKSTQELSHQSIEVEPGVFTSCRSLDGSLVEYMFEDVHTLFQCLQRGLRISKNGDFLGTRTGPNREYEWITYQQVYDRAQRFGSALLAKGLSAGQDSFVGICAPNSPQWVITNYAAHMYSMVLVPVYDTLGRQACMYIINQTEMSVMVCDSNQKAQKVLEFVDNTPSIKLLIIMEDVSNDNSVAAEKYGIELISFADMEALGANKLQDIQPAQPADLAMICYTSGTTGDAKGVMLTHRNFIANIAGCFKNQDLPTTTDDVHISYLPLAHVMENIMQSSIASHGGKIGFFGGDIKLLFDDAAALKPSLFPCVPRLINRVYDKVGEGYGQTEATACITVTLDSEYESGHVGVPSCCNVVKLIDVPEMEYYAANKQGEVCAKGYNIMRGYYKNPEKTREALDDDGWLHTGDIGEWQPNGTLKIIDRKKHIFKLAQGEYVAPEKIENIYVRSSLVAQAFVDGDSLQHYPVAIIVPDPDVLPGWAKQQGIVGTMEELCQNKTIQEAIHKDILKQGKEANLAGFEQVCKIYLHSELFSIENRLLTPTLKSKRAMLRKVFGTKIKEMYV